MTSFQVMQPLDADEYAALEADIVANGVLQPVLVDEHNNIIDGHHRKSIAVKHGLRCPEIKCAPNLTNEAKRTLAFGVNAHRRHLTPQGRYETVCKSLLSDPQLSDRLHADRTGTSHPFVGKVRADLVEAGRLEAVASRLGADGKQYTPGPGGNGFHLGDDRPSPSPGDDDLGAEADGSEDDPGPGDADDREASEPVEPATAGSGPALTQAEQDAIDLAENVTRRRKRLEGVCSGWHELRGLRTQPLRAEVLAALCDNDRHIVLGIEEELWNTK